MGEIISLEVDESNLIKVTFAVRKAIANKIRKDSLIRVVRSFMISDKRLNLYPGSSQSPLIPLGGIVSGEDSREIADLLSGGGFGARLVRLKGVAKGVEKIGIAIGNFVEQMKPNDHV